MTRDLAISKIDLGAIKVAGLGKDVALTKIHLSSKPHMNRPQFLRGVAATTSLAITIALMICAVNSYWDLLVCTLERAYPLDANIVSYAFTIKRGTVRLNKATFSYSDRDAFRMGSALIESGFKCRQLPFSIDGPDIDDSDINWHGFGMKKEIYHDPAFGMVGIEFTFSFPIWLAIGVFCMYPIYVSLKIWRSTKRVRQMPRVCDCGYDLRASPHRCPECGRPTGSE